MIRMSDEEVSSFLDSQVYGVLGSAGLDGLPHMLYVGYLAIAGKIAVTTFRKSQKFVNAERAGAASFLVEISQPYSEIRGFT
jgi:nitroimidazol reductase NimA-like FMN-containing flavoprotein (pyridoxamine 5'-phosphate oxidase superfamily)